MFNQYSLKFSLLRYGKCEEYVVETEVCADVLVPGSDYVFIRNSLGTQTSISTTLAKNYEHTRWLIALSDKECLRQVSRAICHYYLPPCGNITHTSPPSSLCHEECVHIQSNCHTAWQAAAISFINSYNFINCDSTSRLLFPLPICCTGAGIEIVEGQLTAMFSNRYKLDTPSKTGSDIQASASSPLVPPSKRHHTLPQGTIAGIATGSLVMVLLISITIVIILYLYIKLHKRKVLERMQREVLQAR